MSLFQRVGVLLAVSTCVLSGSVASKVEASASPTQNPSPAVPADSSNTTPAIVPRIAPWGPAGSRTHKPNSSETSDPRNPESSDSPAAT